MSNAFAIAAVTACLQWLIHSRLAQAKAGGLGGFPDDLEVTSTPPDFSDPDKEGKPRINLYLTEITANAGWSNERLPVRDAQGARVAVQPLALNLGYLITAYGNDAVGSQVLLGHAMQVLHENPGLMRAQIRELLDPAKPKEDTQTEKAFREQAISLADQLETIKITPRFPGFDEMSKIWSAFQSHYRTSVLYQVSVVLIDGQRPANTPLPVLSRGSGDAGVRVQTGLVAPVPTLLACIPPNRQPSVQTNQRMRILGHHLVGTGLAVRFHHLNPNLSQNTTVGSPVAPHGTEPVVLRSPDPGGADADIRALIPRDADACLDLDLNAFQGTWAAGLHRVEASVIPPGETQPRTTNSLAVAIAPRFQTGDPHAPKVEKGSVTPRSLDSVKLHLTPELQPSQVASLILGQTEFVLEKIQDPTADVMFWGRLPPLPPNSAVVTRLRVDGVESQYLDIRDGAAPQFERGQNIEIP